MMRDDRSGSRADAVDTSALTAAVSRAEAEAYFAAQEDAAADAEFGATRGVYGLIAGIGVVLLGVGAVLPAVLPGSLEVWQIVFLVVAGVIGLALGAVQWVRSSPRYAYRIARFAEANGLSYARLRAGVEYEGMPFTHGHSHRRRHVVTGRRNGRRVELGDLAFREGVGRYYARRCGYVAIRLPGKLPHMVLDGGHSSVLWGLTLPVPLLRSQAVEVGAARAFSLYVVGGAEAVARRLFTPDTVALFRSLASRYDMEFLGDVLFLYSRRAVSTTSGRRWRARMDDVDAVTAQVSEWPVWEGTNEDRRAGAGRLVASKTRQIVLPLLLVIAVFAAVILFFALT